MFNGWQFFMKQYKQRQLLGFVNLHDNQRRISRKGHRHEVNESMDSYQ